MPTSHLLQSEIETASHSRRGRPKRPRGKYSSKACVQCRDRKLKCSGDSPCQRCIRGGQLCLFSDEPGATTELLRQNKNILQPPLRPLFPRPPAQDQTHPSEMESRMSKVESALQTLIELIPRNSNRNSVEPRQADDEDGFQGDTAFQAPLEAFNANLASLREQLGYQGIPDSSRGPEGIGLASTPARTVSSIDSLAQNNIRFGSKTFPYPSGDDFTRYLDTFFEDVNSCHPCINEPEFRSRCQRLVANRTTEARDTCLLATTFIIFACTDILTYVGIAQDRSSLPGWQWYLAADELMGRRKISGRGDVSLIQYLVYEAFYLVHVDHVNAAYNVSGLACRLCFQLGLHQQRLWVDICSAYTVHIRQCLFWTVYFVDRRISLSCGRPYGMRDSDIEVNQPAWLDDRAVFPDQPLPEPDFERSNVIYLSCMVVFARFSGEVWDQAFAVSALDSANLGERVAILDARIQYWMNTSMQNMPFSSNGSAQKHRHLWQETLVRTRMNHLRLLLRRRAMVSLSYSASDGVVSGDVAIDIVRDLQSHASEIASSSSSRYYMATALGGAIIILATLLCRDLSTLGIQEHRGAYMESYQLGTSMLRELASTLPSTARILNDLKEIMKVVDLVLQQAGSPTAAQRGILMDMIPTNMDDLFPYDPVAFNSHFIADDLGAFDAIPTSTEASGIAGTVDDHNIDLARNSWDDPMYWTTAGYGVPWV